MTHDYELDLELKNLVQANQPPTGDLPDPAIIWFKAEFLRKRQLREEAVRPMVRAQQAGIALALLVLAGLGLTGNARGLMSAPNVGVIAPQLLIVLIAFLAVLVWSYRSVTIE
jgi:hypothetical protein